MSKSYSIGEVATMTKLSIPTIRYYDKEGLIPELKKDASGARCFDDQNLGARNDRVSENSRYVDQGYQNVHAVES